MNAAERLYLQAVNGNVVAARFLIEQTCGRAKETVQLEAVESDVGEVELLPLVLEYVGNLSGEELQRMRSLLPDKALCEEDTTGSS